MAAVVESDTETEVPRNPWRDFVGGSWQDCIDVRNFIQRNYTPYEGDECFLTGSTARTKKLWEKLTHLFDEERKNGVLAVSQVPSGILAHGPGYIDKDSTASTDLSRNENTIRPSSTTVTRTKK